MLPEQQRLSTASNRSKTRGERTRLLITQELVMAVADRVYVLLLQELRIERERFRSDSARR